jgi:hypothetical protein
MMDIEHVDQDIFVPVLRCALRVSIEMATELSAQEHPGDLITESVIVDRYLAVPFATL